MPNLQSRSTIAALASVFAGAILFPRIAGWAQPDQIVELTMLVLAAIAAACLRVQAPATADRTIMPPAFVATVLALLLFGPHVAMCVAAAVTLTAGLVTARGDRLALLIDALISAVSAEAAGLAYQSMGGVPLLLEWPW